MFFVCIVLYYNLFVFILYICLLSIIYHEENEGSSVCCDGFCVEIDFLFV